MNQVVIGLAIPFAVGLVVYVCRRFRASLAGLIVLPILMGLCALWAVAPDIPRLLGMHALYARLALDPRMDIFFWHYSIDLIETDAPWFAAGFVIVAAGMLGAAWRELRIAESARDSGGDGGGRSR